MELLFTPDALASFITLVVLEIVLGVDNLILLSILTDRLPKTQQPLARRLGILGAVLTRIVLIALAFWIVHLRDPLFSAFGHDFSWADVMLMAGGLFLLAKGTLEIHKKVEEAGEDEAHAAAGKNPLFWAVVAQIMVMDVVFSFDSVMTAVGVASHLSIMVSAILISVVFMLAFAESVHSFIARHPTVKVLALSYMLLIGMTLMAEGFGAHVPKGYLYFAMAFSFGVEALNMVIRSRSRGKQNRK